MFKSGDLGKQEEGFSKDSEDPERVARGFFA